MEQIQVALQLATQSRDAALAQQATADAARLATVPASAAAATAAGAGPTTFALSPALANSNTLLNYNTSEGIKIYNKAMAPHGLSIQWGVRESMTFLQENAATSIPFVDSPSYLQRECSCFFFIPEYMVKACLFEQ
jgi:hypothetical protein